MSWTKLRLPRYLFFKRAGTKSSLIEHQCFPSTFLIIHFTKSSRIKNIPWSSISEQTSMCPPEFDKTRLERRIDSSSSTNNIRVSQNFFENAQLLNQNIKISSDFSHKINKFHKNCKFEQNITGLEKALKTYW